MKFKIGEYFSGIREKYSPATESLENEDYADGLENSKREDINDIRRSIQHYLRVREGIKVTDLKFNRNKISTDTVEFWMHMKNNGYSDRGIKKALKEEKKVYQKNRRSKYTGWKLFKQIRDDFIDRTW